MNECSQRETDVRELGRQKLLLPWGMRLSSVGKTKENEQLSSTRLTLSSGVSVSSRKTMVKETIRTCSSSLPAPSGYNGTGQSPGSNGKQAKPPRNSAQRRTSS